VVAPRSSNGARGPFAAVFDTFNERSESSATAQGYAASTTGAIPKMILLRRPMKRLLALIMFFAFPAMATTYTAASNAQSAVQAAINLTSSSGGDTVQIPCTGTQTVTWTGTLTSSNNFTLTALGATPNTGTGTFGAGTNCLTIVDNNTSGPVMNFTPTYQPGQSLVIQNMNIDPFTATTTLASPVNLQGTCTGSGCPSVRVDNLIFGNATRWTESGTGTQADWMIRADNVFGVLDHNSQPAGSQVDFLTAGLSGYLGVGDNGDNSWAQPDSFGTANALYLENNDIHTNQEVTDCEKSPSSTVPGGCRLVGRYNHVTADNGMYVAFSYHGMDTGGRERGGRQLEVYNNVINCLGTGPSSGNGCGDVAAGFRAGTGYVFGNVGNSNYTATGGFYGKIADITVYRTVYAAGTWGGCAGMNSLGPWDTNDNTVYYSGTMTTSGGLTMTDSSKSWATNQFVPSGAPYSVYDVTQGTGFIAEIASNTATTITINGPISESGWTGFNNGDSYQIVRATVCGDQGGRGQGMSVSGTAPTPSSSLNQALDPIYEWDDIASNLNHGNIAANTARTIANRDWYTDNSNGTPHVQTSATSPFNGSTTCNAGAGNYTCGVGFGTLANRPTTCVSAVGYFATDVGSQGTLYACKTANTWTSIYAPYAYPHPLEAGGTTGSLPQPPTSLIATVN
jgi:hypothetical protein